MSPASYAYSIINNFIESHCMLMYDGYNVWTNAAGYKAHLTRECIVSGKTTFHRVKKGYKVTLKGECKVNTQETKTFTYINLNLTEMNLDHYY